MKNSKTKLLLILFIILISYILFFQVVAFAQVLFQDNFQDKNASQWQLEQGWQIDEENKNYLLSGKGHSWARLEQGPEWTDYSFQCWIKLIEGNIHLNFHLSQNGQFSRYFVGFSPEGIYLNKQVGEQFDTLVERMISLNLNQWYWLKIIVKGREIKIYVDDRLMMDYLDSNPLKKGTIALESLKESLVFIDDIRVMQIAQLKTHVEENETKKLEVIPSSMAIQEKGDMLQEDEVWSGEILVTHSVVVPEGITLTIEPGTAVKFKHYRGYREPHQKTGLTVAGGTLKAIGTPQEQIIFTSDAEKPINGDWLGISLVNTKDSEFDYVIVEFGEIGIEQFDSEVPVMHSIIRWNNSEGLYAERSKPIFSHNTIYGNAYHEIALEQYNQVKIYHNTIRDGHFGIHHEKTEAHLKGNYFKNEAMLAITAGMDSNLLIEENKFEDIGNDPPIGYDHTCTLIMKNNDFGDNNLTIPTYDYKNIQGYDLGYIPGDINDKHLYIYDDKDETRRVVKKIGQDLSFGWALNYARDKLWRFSLGHGEMGEQLDFIEVNPETGKFRRYRNDWIMNPRGLTYDGKYFWVNDFSLLKVFKFKLNGEAIEILDSFDIPEKEQGGTNGLASDGQYLYLRSRDGSKVYQLDQQGHIVDSISFPGSSLVWTGDYFWTSYGCGRGICKYDKEGQLVGSIYPVAKETWAIAWDGKYLWTIQRTCEMWNDPKIYQIEVLDDSLD
jgi:hypothetical protein